MSEQWAAVDAYLADKVLGDDPVLDAAIAANADADLPTIDVSPVQGKLLHLLARIAGTRRILEIGTLGGYSTIWMARALPENGVLVTLEIDRNHAEIARANCERAGVGGKVEIRVGAALDTLDLLVGEGTAPFDMVFIDADKENNARYVAHALGLSRSGALIVVDNVVRDGGVLDGASADPMIQGTRRLFDMLAAEPRLDATAIQTVGVKGWDGFTIMLVRE